MKLQKEKILVAMSGGVDSSVAAALLLEQGYDVTGAFMINYTDLKSGISCWSKDYQDAVRVAAKLGIGLIKLDFQKEYNEKVLKYLFQEYEKGLTPNPDVVCNKDIKFGVWLKKAKALGFSRLATGHYAGVKQDSKGKYHLMMSKDDNKDQTYFLNQLNQKQLAQVLFPLEDYTKKEVRAIARRFNLPTAEKGESMGICFVGEVRIDDFLKNKIKSHPGNILLSSGEKVGKHQGLSFYTLGQRHFGLGKIKSIRPDDQPLFVVAKKKKRNELIVGYADDTKLFKEKANLKKINWVSGYAPNLPFKCHVRLRHRQTMIPAVLDKDGKKVFIKFESKQKAVTPGQFAVIYFGQECLGGGVIA